MGCIGSATAPPTSTGAGSVTKAPPLTHCVGPAVLCSVELAVAARMIATADRDGGGATIALTALLSMIAAAPFVSVKLTRAEF